MFGNFTVAIDNVQQTKSKVLSSVITDEKIRAPFQALIDAETAYAKAVAGALEELYNVNKAFKFDTFKFGK
jgi:hypothetical protein